MKRRDLLKLGKLGLFPGVDYPTHIFKAKYWRAIPAASVERIKRDFRSARPRLLEKQIEAQVADYFGVTIYSLRKKLQRAQKRARKRGTKLEGLS